VLRSLEINPSAKFKSALTDLSVSGNFSLVHAEISKRLLTRTSDEWCEIFDREGVWYAEVQRFEDVLVDVQANSTGAFASVEGVDQKLVACPIQFSCAEHAPKGRAPLHGEHTTQVLAALQKGDEGDRPS
jgi:crotonobetainyl-CoA:carnitine CoA-transferase CaiB-like acyl-CoA transferase